MSESLAAEVKAILVSEGADSEGGWHSWRCFDKERYPEPCTCTDDVADMVLSAVLNRARDAAREAVAVAYGPEIPCARRRCIDERCKFARNFFAAIDALKEKP